MNNTTLDSTPSCEDQGQVYRKITWRLAPLLFTCYIVAYIDRVNVGFAKLQMVNELGFSAAAYGFGAGLFFVGYFFFEVPSNLILYKVGARRWIARIMVTWAIVSAAMVFVSSTTTFYILRFLLGAAEAGLFPGIVFYLTKWYPMRRRGHILALFLTGIPIAGVIGSPVSGIILDYMDGMQGLSGWQWLFLLEAIPSLVMAVVVLLCLDDYVEDVSWLNKLEKEIVASDLKADDVNATAHSLKEGFINPYVWLLSLIYFFFIAGLYGVGFWLPTLIKSLGYNSDLTIGLLTAVPYLFGAVAMVVVGRNSDKFQERRWHLTIPGALGTVGWIVSVLFAHSPILSLISLTIATMAVMVSISQFWCLPSAVFAGAAAAVGVATVNSIGNLSGFLSPWAVGLIIDATGSTRIGVYILAAALIAGSLLVLTVPSRLVNR